MKLLHNRKQAQLEGHGMVCKFSHNMERKQLIFEQLTDVYGDSCLADKKVQNIISDRRLNVDKVFDYLQ